MYVRVSTGRLAPAQLPALAQAMAHADTSDLQEEKGYRGGATFFNHQTGELMALGYWETEADLTASLPFHEARAALVAGVGVTEATIKTYEVIGTR